MVLRVVEMTDFGQHGGPPDALSLWRQGRPGHFISLLAFWVMADRWADMAGGIWVSLLPVWHAGQLKAYPACLRIFSDLSSGCKKYLTCYLIGPGSHWQTLGASLAWQGLWRAAGCFILATWPWFFRLVHPACLLADAAAGFADLG
ncbi:hypothetical protein [Aquitalea sp. ASV15]|uniref:hypothetical protein n=1 Tax=Aquitalea sp. ASV15 TaxID=2795104 RepID=UPI0018EBAB25|nr:hypothetical protein [Aquitalea sp. ASV15]